MIVGGHGNVVKLHVSKSSLQHEHISIIKPRSLAWFIEKGLSSYSFIGKIRHLL